jgi:hypothetical protein
MRYATSLQQITRQDSEKCQDGQEYSSLDVERIPHSELLAITLESD